MLVIVVIVIATIMGGSVTSSFYIPFGYDGNWRPQRDAAEHVASASLRRFGYGTILAQLQTVRVRL